MSCPFKDALGVPGKGVHAMRIPVLDWALVDTAMTIIGAWLLQRYIFTTRSYLEVLLGFFLLGELLHAFFCVDSKVLVQLFAKRLE
jgi:hypothetical protein